MSLNAETSIAPVSTKVLPREPSIMDHAASTAEVSAFCRAVLRELIPHEFWGVREVQVHNEAVFHRNIDRFIGLRRFETLSLHEVSQRIKVGTTPALCLIVVLTVNSDHKYPMARATQLHSAETVTVRSQQTYRTLSRVPLLCFRLYPHSSHSGKLPRYGIKYPPLSSIFLSTRCVALIG